MVLNSDSNMTNPFIEYEQQPVSRSVQMNPKITDPFRQWVPLQTDSTGRQIPKVDNWQPRPNTGDVVIFSTLSAGAISAPVRKYYKYTGDNNQLLDVFITSSKKCYNSDSMRAHTCHYLNYFENFFDREQEYFSIVCYMKFIIDNGIVNPTTGLRAEYTREGFLNDLRRFVLSPNIVRKVEEMVNFNYSLDLDYKNINNPSLQYTDVHAKRLMEASILQNLCIPLLTHFAYMQKNTQIDDFLLEAFDHIFSIFHDVDIYNKLYETSSTNISKSEQANIGIWAKQDIRGRNVTTHSLSSVNNIILNIMPKYIFSQNIVSMNYSSIINNTGFQILDIEFEYNFIPLSSSKKDEDNMSDLDKFESNVIKQDESKYLAIKVNCLKTMETIESMYGPFSEAEIEFYKSQFTGDNWLNGFQRQLIFLLFYRFFGDSESIKAINKDDYIKLMIASKKILLGNNMLLLPYIISGKVEKLNGRKSVNKKESLRLQANPNYQAVMDKYKNPKIEKIILGYVATIISSEFRIIDYYNKHINGKLIDIIPDMIIEEILVFILLV